MLLESSFKCGIILSEIYSMIHNFVCQYELQLLALISHWCEDKRVNAQYCECPVVLSEGVCLNGLGNMPNWIVYWIVYICRSCMVASLSCHCQRDGALDINLTAQGMIKFYIINNNLSPCDQWQYHGHNFVRYLFIILVSFCLQLLFVSLIKVIIATFVI